VRFSNARGLATRRDDVNVPGSGGYFRGCRVGEGFKRSILGRSDSLDRLTVGAGASTRIVREEAGGTSGQDAKCRHLSGVASVRTTSQGSGGGTRRVHARLKEVRS